MEHELFQHLLALEAGSDSDMDWDLLKELIKDAINDRNRPTMKRCLNLLLSDRKKPTNLQFYKR